MEPPLVIVQLPSLLANVTGGETEFEVNASTLAEALDEACRRCPAIRVHLFDETGDLREHVLCFHNDVNSRWVDSRDAMTLVTGDRVTVMQAVSGG